MPYLKLLFRNTYANYFIKSFFLTIDNPSRNIFIIELTKNLPDILESQTGVNGLFNFLNLEICFSDQKSISTAIMDHIPLIQKLDSYKILEALVENFNEANLDKLIVFLIKNFRTLIKSQGSYYTIKKLILKTKSKNVQMALISLAIENFDDIVFCNFGNYYIQNVIIYFPHQNTRGIFNMLRSRMLNLAINPVSHYLITVCLKHYCPFVRNLFMKECVYSNKLKYILKSAHGANLVKAVALSSKSICELQSILYEIEKLIIWESMTNDGSYKSKNERMKRIIPLKFSISNLIGELVTNK